MCSRVDHPPYPDTATDAREDAVCPLHGPNLYAAHDYGQPCRCPECDPDEGPPEPIIPPGPGWYGHGPNYDDDSDPVFAAVHLEPEPVDAGATRAVLYIRAEMFDGSERREVGAELTVDDLAHIIFRAASIAEAAALEDERHFAAEAFARVRDHITRVVDPAPDPNP